MKRNDYMMYIYYIKCMYIAIYELFYINAFNIDGAMG